LDDSWLLVVQLTPSFLAILTASAVLLMGIPALAYGQQGYQMNMDENVTASTNATSTGLPMTYDIEDSNVRVNLSWQPESIDIDGPTTFTFEFLDSNTGERLSDVSYSVHLMVDDKTVIHGHEDTAPEGIGTMEQQFDETGALTVIVDTIAIGDNTVDSFAQFDTTVVPEFSIMLVGVITSISILGSALASRLYFNRA